MDSIDLGVFLMPPPDPTLDLIDEEAVLAEDDSADDDGPVDGWW